MELSFIVSALRRRAWLVAAIIAVSLLPGIAALQKESATFESKALLGVAPPDNQGGASVERERYAGNQVNILKGEGLAGRVAARVGQGFNAAVIASIVDIQQRQGTDIVDVKAHAADPAVANSIAQAYVELYIEDQRQRASQINAEELRAVRASIAALDKRRSDLNNAIAEAVRNFQRPAGITEIVKAEIAAPAQSAELESVKEQLKKSSTKRGALRTADQFASNE